MSRYCAFVVAVCCCLALGFSVVVLNPAYAKVVKIERPKWVEKQLGIEFESGYASRYAWARPFGWGEAMVGGNKANWFSWSNTDGYIQFQFSAPLPSEMVKRLLLTRDVISHNWGVTVDKEKGETWLGVSNDPTFEEHPYFQFYEEDWNCGGRLVLDHVVGEIQTAVPGLKMKVSEYLPKEPEWVVSKVKLLREGIGTKPPMAWGVGEINPEIYVYFTMTRDGGNLIFNFSHPFTDEDAKGMVNEAASAGLSYMVYEELVGLPKEEVERCDFINYLSQADRQYPAALTFAYCITDRMQKVFPSMVRWLDVRDVYEAR